ncbi:hypothetical protein V2P20_03820 [Methylobacter sp. Wu1]|uniref:hypothetical protein n=1 Tax=Methylobacter sp. Wu1 TaxID=3119359 RepID=UPI002F937781
MQGAFPVISIYLPSVAGAAGADSAGAGAGSAGADSAGAVVSGAGVVAAGAVSDELPVAGVVVSSPLLQPVNKAKPNKPTAIISLVFIACPSYYMVINALSLPAKNYK